MSRHSQRSFYSDNGTLTDITISTNDYRQDSFVVSDYVAGEDYIYVGSDWTFNSLHFDLSVFNTSPSVVSVELWSGQNEGWKDVVNLLDYSDVGGISLARNGHITWDRDPDEAWHREHETADIPELSTAPDVRDFFWARFKWSADLTDGMTVKHIGYSFHTDQELYSFYPEFNNDVMKSQWSTGKTDWNEQAFMASDILIRDLKKQNIIDFRGQLLDFELWKDASIHKTAEIIYAGLGRPRAEERQAAARSYESAKNVKQPKVDMNADARLSLGETVTNKGYMRR